jgi:hypothetical protein
MHMPCPNFHIKAGCKNMLVVDRCTRAVNHLDISTAAGDGIVGSDTGFFDDITAVPVPQSQCADIWTGQMHPKAGPSALLAPGIQSFHAMEKGIVNQIADGQVQVPVSPVEALLTSNDILTTVSTHFQAATSSYPKVSGSPLRLHQWNESASIIAINQTPTKVNAYTIKYSNIQLTSFLGAGSNHSFDIRFMASSLGVVFVVFAWL